MGAPKFWGAGAVGPVALGQKLACSRGRDPPAGGQPAAVEDYCCLPVQACTVHVSNLIPLPLEI